MPPDRWLELTVRADLDPGAVSQILLELGGTAVQESEGVLVTYLSPPSNIPDLLREVQRRLQELRPGEEPELDWRWQPHEDWESLWRRGLGPRQISRRLLVAPTWEAVDPSPGTIVITLDPGVAFGTAEHATTRGCLRALDSTVTEGSRIADVGAGSGILSIAAAHLGAREVVALELDELSCETAAANLARNGVADRVTILHTRVGEGAALPGAPFDGIVANLQSDLLIPLFPLFKRSLDASGWLVASGILEGQHEEILDTADRLDFRLDGTDLEDGWWTGIFRPSRPLP